MTHEEMNEELSEQLQHELEALPREIAPARDLWTGIAHAIDSEKVVRTDFAQRQAAKAPAGPVNWRRMGLVAAAAMLLVTVSSGITAYLVRVPTTPTVGQGAEPAADQPATSFETVAWEEFLAAEREYQVVTDDLLSALDEQRAELAPETVQLVEKNIRLINGAISETREALERDPANARLANKLTGMYRTRVTFLRNMSRL